MGRFADACPLEVYNLYVLKESVVMRSRDEKDVAKQACAPRCIQP